MKSLKSLFTPLLFAATFLSSGASLAYGYGDFDQRRDEPRAHWGHSLERDIDARQRFQHDRLEAGRRSGKLTPREFMGLMHQQREIRLMEQRYMADGRLNRFEYERLDAALDHAAHAIRRQARDDDRFTRDDDRFARDERRPRDYN